jgi:hypothetical protein
VVLLAVGVIVAGLATPSYAVTTATVCLVDSGGIGIPGAQAQFRSGTWQTIGLTGDDGCVGTEAPAAQGNRAFRVTYNGQTEQKTQNTTTDPTVTFTTIRVTGQLLDSTGIGIPGALIQYNASGWKDLGTTDSNGQASAEMLTASRPFRVTYNGQTEQKTQDTTTDPTVTFQTGRVLQGTGARVLRYQASGWKPFFDGIELLPGRVVFDLDVGPNEAHEVLAGVGIYVPIAPTPPVVTAGDALGDEGEAVLVQGSFTDLESGQTHIATIDWGDGSPVEAGVVDAADGLGGLVTGSHAYADEGLYSVILCVTDDGNPDATGCSDLEVMVANVAPVVTILGPDTVDQGAEASFTVEVVDPGVGDSRTYLWVVARDGEQIATGSDSTLTFTPAASGDHLVTVTVDDGDGGTGLAQVVVPVAPLQASEPPTVEPTIEEPDPGPSPDPVDETPAPAPGDETSTPDGSDDTAPADHASNTASDESPAPPQDDTIRHPAPGSSQADPAPTGSSEADPAPTGSSEANPAPTPPPAPVASTPSGVDNPPQDEQVSPSHRSPEAVEGGSDGTVDGGFVSPTSLLVILGSITALIGVFFSWQYRRRS